MYKQDLALNNLQGLISHKTQPTKLNNFLLYKQNMPETTVTEKSVDKMSYNCMYVCIMTRITY